MVPKPIRAPSSQATASTTALTTTFASPNDSEVCWLIP